MWYCPHYSIRRGCPLTVSRDLEIHISYIATPAYICDTWCVFTANSTHNIQSNSFRAGCLLVSHIHIYIWCDLPKNKYRSVMIRPDRWECENLLTRLEQEVIPPGCLIPPTSVFGTARTGYIYRPPVVGFILRAVSNKALLFPEFTASKKGTP